MLSPLLALKSIESIFMLLRGTNDPVEGVGTGVRRVVTRPTLLTLISSRSIWDRWVPVEVTEVEWEWEAEAERA